MHTQKVRLLRRLSESEVLRVLSGKALKLYLVLLVSADRIGQEKTIDMQTMRRALGHELTRSQLLRIGAALKRRGLATLRAFSRPLKPGGHDDIWCFRVLGTRGREADGRRKVQDPRPRRRR